MVAAILIILFVVVCLGVFIGGLIYGHKHPRPAKPSNPKSLDKELEELGWF